MNWLFFLALIAQIESGNNPNLIGDKHLPNKAYGAYQIRKIFVDDVNRISGFNFTLEEVVSSDSLSRWCIIYYLKHYGQLYTKKTGKQLNMEIAAMIYNGGPNGWNKTSTIKYRVKFNSAMKNWPPSAKFISV